MSYVAKIIAADEEILTLTYLHWIYVFEGALWFLFWLVLGLIADHYLLRFTDSNEIGFVAIDIMSFHSDAVTTPVTLIFGAIGLAGFLYMLVFYISVEVGLTNKRLIYKKGLIIIEIQQVDLIDMRAENVNHGWLGWLFGYGRLHLDCRFIEDLHLPSVVKPYDLVKAIHSARALYPDLDYEEKELGILSPGRQRREGAAPLKTGKIIRSNVK